MRSIKSRLTFYVLLTTVIPVLAFLLYTVLFVNEGFRDSEIDAHETKITWSAQYLEQLNEQMDDIVYSLHLEEGLLSDVDESTNESADLEDIIKSTLYNNSNILAKVTVVSTNTYRGVSFDYENGFNSKEYYYDDLFISPSDESFGLKYIFDGSDILVLHTINDFDTQNLQGLIVLKLAADAIEELDTILGVDSTIVLYSSEEELLNESFYEIEKLQVEYKDVQTIGNSYVWSERISGIDLYISYIVPINEINAFSRTMFVVGLAIILISFVLSMSFSFIFTNDITSPIILLADHMKTNELVEYENESKKYMEIDVLETAYNNNIREINELITEKFKNEIERQSIQLRALQAQINPHFLSNTFQLIGGMALERDAQDIYEATIKMSKLVRYSMRIEQKAVSMSEELEHIKGYLDIQKLRFGKRLHYTVDISDKIKEYKIPKFTIQPIIENSFKYGLKKITRQWELKIYSEVSDKVYIHIEDNGVGIDMSDIDDLNKMFDSEETSFETDRNKSSVGLYNINSRIRLLYGNEYGLGVSNNEGNGVTVTISLPKSEVNE